MTLDLDDSGGLERLLRSVAPAVVVHAAGATPQTTGEDDWRAFVMGNVGTTASIVEAITRLPVNDRPSIVVAGSQREYGRAPMPWTEGTEEEPVTAYGASKLAATQILVAAARAGTVRASVVRFPILFGPHQASGMFVPELIQHALSGRDFEMTPGEQRRTFVYVEDAAKILLEVGDRLRRNDLPLVINSPATSPIRLLDMANGVLRMVGGGASVIPGAKSYRVDEQLAAWPDTSLAMSLGLSCRTPLMKALHMTIGSYMAADVSEPHV